jgi:uncharacterized linocin/CFP29 family protein
MQKMPDSPLSAAEWSQMHNLVVENARCSLVGRYFMEIYGPLGAGVQSIPSGLSEKPSPEEFEQPTEASILPPAQFQSVPLIYRDFYLDWRDLQAAREQNIPLDFSVAIGAAKDCARKEDELILLGDPHLGIEGLLRAKGQQVVSLGREDRPGIGLAGVVNAIEKLNEVGQIGPFALVIGSRWYAKLHQILEGTCTLEIDAIRQLVLGGVFQSSFASHRGGVLVSMGAENIDLAVAVDLQVTYVGPERMSHPFRVFEAVLPRIKKPNSICSLVSEF